MGSREWGVGNSLPHSLLPIHHSPSSVIFRHRVSDAYCQNSFNGVSRPRHYFSERVTIFSREFREDEIRGVGDGMIGRDAQTQAGKTLRAQFLDNRLQPLLAASAPLLANANPAEGKRQIVADDQDRRCFFDPVLFFQGGDCDPAQVHEGLRLGQQNLFISNGRPSRQRMTLRSSDRSTRAARQLINNHETAVVARPVVFRPRIAQTNDQPHSVEDRGSGIEDRALKSLFYPRSSIFYPRFSDSSALPFLITSGSAAASAAASGSGSSIRGGTTVAITVSGSSR